MNTKDLEKNVKRLTSELAYLKGYVCSIDVFIKLGFLSEKDYEDWRFKRVSYLEKVCQVNLHKLSAVNKFIRKYSVEWNFEKSSTYYHSWGKSPKTKLIFSKSRIPNIEEGYATHYLNKKRISELKALKNQDTETNKTTNT